MKRAGEEPNENRLADDGCWQDRSQEPTRGEMNRIKNNANDQSV